MPFSDITKYQAEREGRTYKQWIFLTNTKIVIIEFDKKLQRKYKKLFNKIVYYKL